jgi:glycerol-3-phosphate dehydrogenase
MRSSDPPHVLIVGGGGTGGALAHDLRLRGVRVTLVERGELTSGTTGRHHGLLHSGARYAVADQESAVECIQENRILRRIAPDSFEENGGLFVAITDEDMDYRAKFLAGCGECGIPTRELTPAQALALEPGLHPGILAAVLVPDATMDAMRMPLRFFATARRNGAVLRPFTEVTGLRCVAGRVTGAIVRDRLTGRDADIPADLVVNATGPWSQRIAELAGAVVPLRPSPGVLLALHGRLCNLVVNRLHPAGDGDIVVPQRALSVVGTSSWVTDDPDDLGVPDEHVEAMVREGARLLPAVARARHRAAWSAARPLIGATGAAGGRELSRTFKCFDHAVTDGVEGFVTITGGKATTLRGMAEVTADLICAKLGVDATCRTRAVPLLPHTAHYLRQYRPEEGT